MISSGKERSFLNKCDQFSNLYVPGTYVPAYSGFKISNWMHLSIGQVDCKNHLSKCTIHLSEIYKANATYVEIRNMQSSVGQVLHAFHLSDCHFYSSQTIGRVKFQTLILHVCSQPNWATEDQAKTAHPCDEQYSGFFTQNILNEEQALYIQWHHMITYWSLGDWK